MRKSRFVSLVVLVIAVSWAALAFSADKPACAASCSASCCASKACAATVTGKIECKTEKVDGKDCKTVTLTVAGAKGEDGKDLAGMKGKSLTVIGAKAADCEKLAGKTVEAKGTCKAGKEFEATSVAAK